MKSFRKIEVECLGIINKVNRVVVAFQAAILIKSYRKKQVIYTTPIVFFFLSASKT